MCDTGRPNLPRRRFLEAIGVGAVATSGCLSRFGGFNEGAFDFQTTNLFVSGKKGYTKYRIPALLTARDGTVLAFCEGRRGEGNDRSPTDLLLKRSTDGGETWSDRQVVHTEGNATISNPTPVLDRTTGTIHLPLCRNYRDVLMTQSTDSGATWREPRDITAAVKKDEWGYYGTGPGVGIQLREEPHAGRLIIPATHWDYLWEGEMPADNVAYDHVIYSDDGGTTWHLSETVGAHVDEPQAVELSDGRILMNMRTSPGTGSQDSMTATRRAEAISSDGGLTWSSVTYDSTLVTPQCQASLIRYSWPDGGRSRVLFCNPANTSGRMDLTVRLSYDEGASWAHSKVLYGSRAAYSSLAVLPDGSVGCLFERGDPFGPTYKRITFTRFTIEWLTDGADAPRRD